MNRDQHDKELLKVLKSISASVKSIDKSLSKIAKYRTLIPEDSVDEKEIEDKED